jgi:hypothetical protein
MSNDLESIKEIEENSIWLDEHLEEIKEKNANKFVAIKGKAIILVRDDLNTLLRDLMGKKEDLERLLIEFIHGEDFNFIL